MSKVFQREELIELGLPFVCKGGKVLEDHVTHLCDDSVGHRLVFQLSGQPKDEAWTTSYYRRDRTFDRAENLPWEDMQEVYCYLVYRREIVSSKWVSKRDADYLDYRAKRDSLANTQLKKLLEKALDDAFTTGLEKGKRISNKAALLTLCQEHIAQYRAQGMAGKAEAIAVLAGEIERAS